MMLGHQAHNPALTITLDVFAAIKHIQELTSLSFLQTNSFLGIWNPHSFSRDNKLMLPPSPMD